MKGYEILSKVLNNELKPKTIIMTKHEIEYFDDSKDYDFYLVENDKMIHRCNKEGKLGEKFQDRFLNYKVLQKDFEIYKVIEEEKDIEELPLLGNPEVIHRKDSFISSLLTRNNLDHNEIKIKINELVRELNKIKKEGK